VPVHAASDLRSYVLKVQSVSWCTAGACNAGRSAEARQLAAGGGHAAQGLLQPSSECSAEQEADGRHAEGPGLHVQPAARQATSSCELPVIVYEECLL